MKNKSNKSKPTHFNASISIAIVLFLLGLFFIIFIHTGDLSNILKEKVNIVVELDDTADEKALASKIANNNAVLQGSTSYLSKDDGLSFMTAGKDFLIEGQNPLKDIIVFNIKSTEYSEENIAKLKKVIEGESGVLGVYHENNIIESIRTNITRVATVILVLGLVFIFLAIIIIKNTINLSMYTDRAEIQTLERIGAKWGFIKMPYIKSSVLVGIKGYIIALIMLAAILTAISINFPAIWSTLNLFYIMLSVVLLLLVAVLIPALVSNGAANAYLSRRV